jgi:SAM-dependent methyltransferase
MVPFEDNPRESPRCLQCGSVPRHRALAKVVQELHPDLGTLRVHESSPSACSARWLNPRCADYTGSYYVPGKRPLARLGVFYNVDLGDQRFPDASFDLVITQDVLEHLPAPQRALREMERTLRPGGQHVFTVPRTPDALTRTRAERRHEAWVHRLPAVYHQDPSTRQGSLVVTDWGSDLESLVAQPPFHCRRIEVLDEGIVVPTPIEVFLVERATGLG